MSSGRVCAAIVGGLFLSVGLAARAAEQLPAVGTDSSGGLVISSLPSILGDQEVKRHLNSGLTTSLVFQVRSPASLKGGGARVDVRLELWDEVYLVTVLEGDGRVRKASYDSESSFEQWWSEAELVLSAPAARPVVGLQTKVSLAVVPFSQAELVDTQKWLAESIGQAQGGAGRLGGGSRAVSALIATSMQRRAVRSWSWNLSVERRDRP